jgi:hypothetical protein
MTFRRVHTHAHPSAEPGGPTKWHMGTPVPGRNGDRTHPDSRARSGQGRLVRAQAALIIATANSLTLEAPGAARQPAHPPSPPSDSTVGELDPALETTAPYAAESEPVVGGNARRNTVEKCPSVSHCRAVDPTGTNLPSTGIGPVAKRSYIFHRQRRTRVEMVVHMLGKTAGKPALACRNISTASSTRCCADPLVGCPTHATH